MLCVVGLLTTMVVGVDIECTTLGSKETLPIYNSNVLHFKQVQNFIKNHIITQG